MFHMIADHIASRGHAGYSAYIIKNYLITVAIGKNMTQYLHFSEKMDLFTTSIKVEVRSLLLFHLQKIPSQDVLCT